MSLPRASVRVVVCVVLILVLTGTLFALPSDKQLFQEAEGRFRNRDYAFALERYNILLEEYALSEYVPDAQFRRAMCLYRLGKVEDAYTLLSRVEIRYSSTRYASFIPFWKGIIEYGKGEYDTASVSLEAYLDSGEGSLRDQAFLYKALSLKEMDQLDSAVKALSDLFGETADIHSQPHALSLAASLYIQIQDDKSLYDLYSDVKPSLVPDAWRDNVTLYKGESLWRNGYRDASEEWYRMITDADPGISSAAFQRLFTNARARGDEDATRDLLYKAETALAGQPEVLREFWLRVGIESYRQGKSDLALSYLRRIWDLGNPETQDGLVPLYYATLLFDAGSPDEALEVIDAYMAASSNEKDLLLLRRGSINLNLEKWSAAASDYDTFVTEFTGNPKYQEALYLRAYALYRDEDSSAAVAGALAGAFAGDFASAQKAVNDALNSGAGDYTAKLLLLQFVMHRKSGNVTAAVRSLESYLSLVPEDQVAQVDLATAYFRDSRYNDVLRITQPLLDSEEAVKPGLREEIFLRYLTGLSLITKKEYASALTELEAFTLNNVRDVDMVEIYPYTLFYRGWSLYRLSKYEEAVSVFDSFLRGAVNHPLQPTAAYLAGWCSFSLGEYRDAEQFLSKIPLEADSGLWQKGSFMYGKTLIGLGENKDASQAFQTLFVGFPDSPFADDAIFEYASLRSREGKVDEALDEYDRLYDSYPNGPLAEEALFKRGELLYDNERYAESREAFYQHRLAFPKGKLLDASLYWGGMASVEADEEFGAVLLWEKLVYQFKESTFRSDAMRRTAEIYEQSGDYREAFKLYSELIAVYPKVAAAVKADDKAEKLRYLLLGQSEREAELSVIIGRENGSRTKAGREAIIELARIYIFKSGDKQDTARKMLQEVAKRADEDPSSAARAEYLLGEYYYRKNVLDRAANAFLEAATLYPEDPDLTASSLLRAAEMLKLSGKTADTEYLVKRITESFPDSQWATEAAKLLEGDQ